MRGVDTMKANGGGAHAQRVIILSVVTVLTAADLVSRLLSWKGVNKSNHDRARWPN